MGARSVNQSKECVSIPIPVLWERRKLSPRFCRYLFQPGMIHGALERDSHQLRSMRYRITLSRASSIVTRSK